MTLGEPIRVWHSATGTLLAEFDGSNATFSPDSRMVASLNIARNDTVAHIRDARSGRSLAEAQHARGVVQALAFSPDGKWLVTLSDNAVGIWEANSGRSLRWVISPSKVLSVRIAPDAKWLVLNVWEPDGSDSVQLYPWERFAPTDDLVAWASTFVVRKIRSDELYRYGISQ